MAERFRFFDSTLNENNLPDREYNAQEFTDYFKALVTTGLMQGAANELKVDTPGNNMVTTIDTGIAFILGRYYENDSLLPHTHDTEVLGRNRIDRIVIRMDLNTDARHVKSFIKKGVASASPVAPVLQQDENIYEISLAQVKVIGGQTFVNKADIVDERGKDVICPYAGSNILPNFDDDEVLELLYSKADKEQEPWITATLQNGWAGTIRFYKDEFGVLHIDGVAMKSNPQANDVIFTVPEGYRHAIVNSQFLLSTAAGSFGKSVEWSVFNNDGTVRAAFPNAATGDIIVRYIMSAFRL